MREPFFLSIKVNSTVWKPLETRMFLGGFFINCGRHGKSLRARTAPLTKVKNIYKKEK
jgi:hypothetical protein